MPSFDAISEWVLANLYLVGAVAGVLLLVVLLLLLLAARRRRDAAERMVDYEVTYAGLDTVEDTDPTDLGMDSLTPPQTMPDDEAYEDFADGDPFAAISDEHPPAAVSDEHLPAESQAQTSDESAFSPPAPAPPPDIPGRAYLPPAHPRGNHTRDIVQGLLSGQGDLTGAELRRLELLRQEKILEAADELEAGLHGRGNESERVRLTVIREHAHLLLHGSDDLDVEQAAAPEQAAVIDHPDPVIGDAATPDHLDPVIGDAVAIEPTLEPVYENGRELDALHSLPPAELGRLFSTTDDKTMKLSIIDALEDTAGPESISVLQACFDDEDPEVQLHALEAAERLLAHR